MTVVLPVYCPHCGSPQSLEIDATGTGEVSEWACPSCNTPNGCRLGGRFVKVWAGHAPELGIRFASERDWDGMRDVFARAGAAAWSHILPPATIASLSAPDRWHPRHSSTVLVAERAGDVIGFVSVRASADEDASSATGEIDALYVLPSVWGQGAGRALLAAGTEQLAGRFNEATLWTEHRNHRPLEFYRAAGWKLDGAERQRTYRGTELLELRHRIALHVPS
jgi:GNAT superfamily N-acetyltransferase